MRLLPAAVLALVFVGVSHSQEPLLRLQHNWWENGLQSFSDCVEVQNDGGYRLERTFLSVGRVDSRQIHLGKFNDAEMKQLNDLLNEPGLRSLTTAKLPPSAVTGTDVWWVFIDRGNESERLWFASSQTSAVPASHLPDANRTPAMKPLIGWYKQLAKRKQDIDKAASPKCSLKIKEEVALPH